MMLANWKPNSYTIQYHANGGVGTVAATTATYDSSVLLRENTFTRVGYKQGTYAWNTKPDGTGTSYSSGQLVKNLIEQDGGVLNLYAVWEPEEYTIYTHKNNGTGDKITDANGKFLVSSTYFTSDNYRKKIMLNSSRLKTMYFCHKISSWTDNDFAINPRGYCFYYLLDICFSCSSIIFLTI